MFGESVSTSLQRVEVSVRLARFAKDVCLVIATLACGGLARRVVRKASESMGIAWPQPQL